MMPLPRTAFLAIPPVDDQYPHKAAREGLRALGVDLVQDPAAAETLITWSPWNGSIRQILANMFSDRSLPVIVMENGWLSPMDGFEYYQVALDGWNGTGRFYAGGAQRWRSFGMPLQPWRDGPATALVVGQRGHPYDDRTAPPAWHERLSLPGKHVLRRGRELAGLPVDWSAIGECHVWTSNFATQALLAGVPVVQHGPNLMLSDLASRPGEPLRRPDREEVFAPLAWAQWRAPEIATGKPFLRALEFHAIEGVR